MNEEIKKYEYDELDLIHVYFDRKTNKCKELVRKEKYDKLQNNWNKLKKWLGNIDFFDYIEDDISCALRQLRDDTENKMQELEQGKDESN